MNVALHILLISTHAFHETQMFSWKSLNFLAFLLSVAIKSFIHLFYIKKKKNFFFNVFFNSSKKHPLLVNLPNFESSRGTQVLMKEKVFDLYRNESILLSLEQRSYFKVPGKKFYKST